MKNKKNKTFLHLFLGCDKSRKILECGFTLVELLVVISIISILSVISVTSYKTAQIKARDAVRKSDLIEVSKALMLYYADNSKFPDSLEFGNSEVGFTGADGTVYMRETPQDPSYPIQAYVYKTNISTFNLFTNLENKDDSDCKKYLNLYLYIVDGKRYCYGVSSPNTILRDW